MCQDAQILPGSSGSALPGTFTGQGDGGDGHRRRNPSRLVSLVPSFFPQTGFQGGSGLRQQLKLAGGVWLNVSPAAAGLI